MLIARDKLRSNIAEYILYMWQVEDIIRAYNFDLSMIEKNIIAQMKLERLLAEETKIWYADLIDRMEQEGIKKHGHLEFVNRKIIDLQNYHVNLLKKDLKYRELTEWAKSSIDDLREKSKNKEMGDVEVCFTGLYGLLVLRIQKKEISEETMIAMKLISNMLAYLSANFMKKNKPVC